MGRDELCMAKCPGENNYCIYPKGHERYKRYGGMHGTGYVYWPVRKKRRKQPNV